MLESSSATRIIKGRLTVYGGSRRHRDREPSLCLWTLHVDPDLRSITVTHGRRRTQVSCCWSRDQNSEFAESELTFGVYRRKGPYRDTAVARNARNGMGPTRYQND